MKDNRKKLIQLRTKLKLYKKLSTKLTNILDGKIELENYDEEIYNKVKTLEVELDDYKLEIDLPDEEWDEDE